MLVVRKRIEVTGVMALAYAPPMMTVRLNAVAAKDMEILRL